ncbi:MAG: hypothetical protein H6Q73_4252 [Firmicutes bacterium]|nr:hypothetical protein [Bacillota bacterium]
MKKPLQLVVVLVLFPMILAMVGWRELAGVDAIILHNQVLALVLQFLCETTIFAGFGGALAGIIGMVLTVVCGRLAYQSRDHLIAVFSTCRQWLPFLLMAITAFWMLALVGVTLVEGIGAVKAIIYSKADSGTIEFGLRLALLVASGLFSYFGVMAVLNLRKDLGAFNIQPIVLQGRHYPEVKAPGLWRYVRNMAQRMGAPMPKHIVIGLAEGFFVTAHDVILQPTGERITGNTLYLPLSLVVLLPNTELEFIIGHELGHFCGLDTEYSLRFVPIYSGMWHSLSALNQKDSWTVRSAIMLGEFFLERFDHAVYHWGRKREFEADKLGAAAVGNRVAARALLRISALMPVMGKVITEVAEHPDEAPADLLEWLVERVRATDLGDPWHSLVETGVNPTDTHPLTQHRLKALGVKLDDALVQEVIVPKDDKGLQFLDAFFTNRIRVIQQLSADLVEFFYRQKEEVRLNLTEAIKEMADNQELRESVGLAGIELGAGCNGFLVKWGLVFGGVGCLVTAGLFFKQDRRWGLALAGQRSQH